ncbi:exosome complex protein Rrp42 [Candidatus Woesearchaeota archaeon]|nr:exosome complex protein Rrp42 [Candidatus Woesearchaeota archaeon]
MNKIMKDYILGLLSKGERMDGRKLDEFRKPIKIEYGISTKSSEGSAIVHIGETMVIAGVKMAIGKPYEDTPDEGSLTVNVELSPMASESFEPGPPNDYSIELARVTDRVVRESGMIDVNKLCIKEGEKIWMVNVDIYPMNDAGNLFDACALAALAAIKDAKMPKIENDKVNYHEKTSKGLPLKKTPISVTVIKIGKHLLVDPLVEEFNALDARLTIGIDEANNPCAIQKGGDAPLSASDIDKMITLAKEKVKELRKVL